MKIQLQSVQCDNGMDRVVVVVVVVHKVYFSNVIGRALVAVITSYP